MYNPISSQNINKYVGKVKINMKGFKLISHAPFTRKLLKVMLPKNEGVSHGDRKTHDLESRNSAAREVKSVSRKLM